MSAKYTSDEVRPSDIIENIDIMSEVLAESDLLEFTKMTFKNYSVNWHHKVMCQKLNDFIDGKINRLIIEVPPQCGKSELVSKRMVAQLLGKNPDLMIVNAGYNHTHISGFNIGVQRIIESEEYRRIFQETTIKGKYQKCEGKWERNVDKFDVCGYRGSYKTVGIGGSLTGSPMDIGIIDDPFKDYEEARSENRREAVWNWYTSVFRTRMHINTRVCIIMTRWHEDDIIGRIRSRVSKDGNDGEDWEVLTLRGISELHDKFEYDPRGVGEALWPEKFNLDFLLKQKFLDEKNFSSLYQQHPSSATGTIFKRNWMLNDDGYLSLPDKNEFDLFCMSWDMSFKDLKTSDYVVGQLWGKIKSSFYLIDQVRGIMDFPATIDAFIAFSEKYPYVISKLVEDTANGPAIISTLKSKIMGIIPVNPSGSKEARASAISPLFKAGNIKLPRRERSPWISQYVEEHLSFPDGKNDDQVDATSQALFYLCNGSVINEIVW